MINMNYKLSAFADEADGNLKKQIVALNENSIGYLEIRGVDGTNISDLSIEQAKTAKKELDNGKIAVWSIGSPIGKYNIDEDFAPHFEKFCHTLELAKIFEAKRIRMFSFFIPEGKDPEGYFGEIISRFGKLLDKAEEYGVTLCHENEKGIYGDVASRCVKLHQALPRLKAVFDPANFVQCGQETTTAYDMLEPNIEYFHVKDCKLEGGVVPAGCGDANVKILVERFLKNGGEILSVEPHLSVFDGLKELEGANETIKKMDYTYRSQREAFDTAVAALKGILEDK